ncbi:MAG: hypothetical protein GFH27_549305n176 [Chloroflexi bacterium AL-W]|nr:hypothetical protein [Chloroflexi bacterium AL-W]
MYRLRAKDLLHSLGLFTVVVFLLGTFFSSISVVQADGSADPVASLNVPTEQFIGEPLSFTVSFDNADPDSADVGYGPYVDLILPAAGVDGAGAAVDDGISFIDANYLGAPLVPISPSPFICAGGTFTHPLTGLATPCVNGTQVVVLQLPFGSFAPDQPVADITVNADLSNLADLATPLDIQARAGFIYGNDPFDNPGSDPPIVQASPASASVTPTLLTLTKDYIGPEDETATGPNFPRQYEIVVDIADGQTITDLGVTDLLPNNMAFLRVVSTTPAGSTTVDTPTVDAAANSPDNDLVVNFPSVTGTAAENDVVVVLEFYIPHLDADGANVIVPTTGDDVLSENEARAIGDWTPIDTRDTGGTDNAVADPAGPEHQLEDKSIAVQKGVSNQNDTGATGYTPGDTLEYALDFQVSDFFIFDTVAITDTFSDGQRLDPGFIPTLEVDGHTFTLAAQSINTNNYTVSENYTGATGAPNPPNTLDPAANDGTTTMIFRISDELITRGQPDGRLIGGCVPPGGTATTPPYCTDATTATVNNGPTQGRIVYRTIIQEAFSDDFPSGDASVDQGDRLDNTAIINGRILDNADATTPVGDAEDDTLADVVIVRGELTKSIYAINGNTTFATPVVVQPADTVTYRIEMTLPSSDIEDLELTDYLPLPVFDATEVTAFDDVVSAAAPAAGRAKFGPDDTFRAIYSSTPALSTTGATANNTVIFTYGDYDDSANTPSRIDVLFTVTVRDDPFADGLFLTNQVRQTEGSTNQSDNFADAIIQIKLAEPDLAIRKGVVAAYNPDNTPRAGASALSLPASVTINAPGACARTNGTVTSANLGTTFNSNLTGVDAGDKATFAIVVENTGSSANGAFDVQIRDALPANVTLVPGSLCVTDGTGATMSFTDVGGGTGLFDQGIELDDPGPTNPAAGALDRGKDDSGSTVTNGRNIAIITYDVTLDTAVRPNESLVNTAILFNYAGTEGGPDHTAPDKTDTATVTVASPTIDKTIVTTNQIHTTGNNVAIGEQIQYQVVITVPEGTSDSVTLVDTLDTGLAFVSLDSITPSSASLSTSAGTFNDVRTSAVISNVSSGNQNLGRLATFNFGTITNSDTNNATNETITLTYTVVVINGGSNDRGDNRNNSAVWRWNNGVSNPTVSASAPNVTIVEPTLEVTKTASPTDADIGDTVTFTLDIAHTGASNADAFNVTLSDVIPAGMTYVPASLSNTAGLAPDTLTESGGTINASWASFPDNGSTSQLQFQVTIASGVIPGQQITNTANIAWTSLPGDVTTPQTSNNPLSTERTGDTGNPGGNDNDHRASDDGTVTVFVPDPQKSIVATSENHTGSVSGIERVTIGEIVRYRMEVRLAESSAPNFQIQDRLPAGLQFLNDGTATVALVATGSGAGNGIESSTLGTSAQVAGDETTLASITPSFVLPDDSVSNDPVTNNDSYASSTDVYFKLGDLMNNDTDANQEFIVIEFNAIVLNIASNQAFDNATGASTPTPRDNSFDVIVDGNTIATSPDVTVRIAEPVVEMTKTAVFTPPVDPGDTISYALLIENTASGVNATAAFDLVVSDTLDSNLTFVSASVTNKPDYTNATDNTAAPNVEFVLDRLDPGDSVTIVVVATVNSVGSPETIPNSADVTYTSLPEDGTATNPTGSDPTTITGTDTGERDGTDGTGGTNDYTNTDDADIVLGSIGDFVWYDINGDGVQDVGEPGIPGVDVTLTLPGPDGILGNGDDVTVTQTTDANGGYDFTGLPAGDYQVDVDQADVPVGMTSLTTANDPENVTLASGQDYDDADFGFTGIGSLGDTVWFDQDNDQTQDANEPGIAGVDVTLIWAGPNGTLGDGDDVTYTTTTDTNGNYLFDNLPAGDFQVDVNTGTLPTGLTTETYDLDGGLDSTTDTDLTAGQDRVDVDFGYMGTGSIGDTVWYDINGDGVQDVGEPGIPGITVRLDLDIDGDGTTDFTTTTTTDANGNYLFNNLPAGDYTVTATPPTGTTPTFDADGGNDNTSDYPLGDGEDNLDQDFGYDGTGSIGDTVWFDINGDGILDTGEPGIIGVSVQLEVDFDGDGTTDFTTTTTTDANGNYLFDDLPTGDYTVTVTPPTGTNPTFDADGGNDNTSDHTLGDGEDNRDQDFGYNGTGSIGDTVWYDINGDGVLDAGEPGIPGVTITLDVDLDGDGATDFTVITTTDANGNYLFDNLPPGDYTVTTDQPAGTTQTYDADGTGTSNTSDYTLADGEDNLAQDFGYNGTGSLGDRVWVDLDGDGVQDAGEPGIGGVNVTLIWYGPDGVVGGGDDVTYIDTTNGSGNYLFNDLPPGEYQVDIDTGTIPTGYVETYDLDTTTTPSTTRTDLAAGQNRTNVDFGYQDTSTGTSTLGDRLWIDTNGDGIQDAGETGINGVTVNLITPGPDGLFGSSDDLITSTVTAGDGNYSFTDLMVGNYRVDVDESTLPTDLSPTFELDSTLDGYIDVSLGTGEVRDDIDFGYQEPDDDVTGSLGDRVWEDTNGNGIQDPGEPGIGGVTITLTGAGPDGVFGTADDTTDTTTTGSDGSYSFTGLPADEYQVTIDPSTVPSGFNETYELDASLDGNVIVTLLPGQDRDDVDFGYTNGTVTPPTGAIGDTIWFDANGDGVQDPGETGIPGVEVTLTWYGPDGVPGGGDDVTYTQITDSSGNYNFTGLPAGEFGVTVNTSTLPPGMQETYDLDGGNDSTAAVSLTDGQVRDDVDFGYTGTGSLGDRIWYDADNDRVQDASETGLGGVTVNLVWYGPDGVPGGGDDVTSTTTTDANGIYTFDNLPAGTYNVQVDTGTLPGSITNPTYELDGTLDATTVVELGAGQDRTNIDFGYTDGDTSANTASIGDRLWIDLNGDGVQDPNEPGLPGVAVLLTWYGPDGVPGGGDDVTYTQTTDDNGTYNFTDLPAGEYHIDIDPSSIPSGLSGTYEVDDGIDGQVDITLTEGEARDDVDFGYQGSGSIGDTVWYDINGNGVQDPNEPGLGGVEIEVLWYGPDGVPGGGDDVTFTTPTDSDGGYSVDGLPLGSYQVIIESGVPDGMEGTSELDNSLNGNTQVNLTPANPDRTDVDFGYTGTGSISQNVWIDEDGNGVRDPGEEGIPGVEVTVTWYGPDGVPGGDDDVIITTTTDNDGNYMIPNLPAGNYQVTVNTDTLPPDLRPTYDRDGGEDSTTDLTVGVGEDVSDINFGYEDTTPTAIVLVSFTANHAGDEVMVRWETSAEIDTWGFHLYRSEDGTWENAQRVTDAMILAEGRGQGGAAYRWTDQDVNTTATYTYWLVETELDGSTNRYGPAQTVVDPSTAEHQIFLPFVGR